MAIQSIIVYRNPIEAHFWESGIAFPLGAALFAFLVLTVLLTTIVQKIYGGSLRTPQWATYTALGAAGFIAIGIFNWLFI